MKTTPRKVKRNEQPEQQLDDRKGVGRARWHKLPKSLDVSKARHPSNAGYVRREQAPVEQGASRLVGLPKPKD